jgi:hypothetical protein
MTKAKQKIDDAHKKAFIEAKNELDILTYKKSEMSALELENLREHARNRTDLKKAENELSPEQWAWREMYMILDKNLEKIIGKKRKKNIDDLLTKRESTELLISKIEKLKSWGIAIENSLFVQRQKIAFHFDEEGNSYKTSYNDLSGEVTNEHKLAEERVKSSNILLEIIDKYRDGYVRDLIASQRNLKNEILDFKNALENLDTTVMEDEPSTLTLIKSFKDWLLLCEELLKCRNNIIIAIENLVDLDAILPHFIVDNGGDLSKKLDSDELFRKASIARVLTKDSFENEDKIKEEKLVITHRLFGIPEDYIKELADSNVKTQNSSTVSVPQGNPLEHKTWFRFVKVVYIGIYFISLLPALSVFLSYNSSSSQNSFLFWYLLIDIAIMTIIKKGFYYIFLGKTDWKN